VNEEIEKQQSIGKSGVPDLLPPDFVNGIEMFGFLSPQIIQVYFYETLLSLNNWPY
jgi:hypothetical protein